MKGKLIVVEGVNGVGKTTLLNAALQMLPREYIVYCKGFTNRSLWDQMINNHPHSFTYYLDLAWKTARHIKPAINNGQNVLQDRYVQTVDSFLPDCELLYNKVFRKLFEPLFLQPDLYIHISANTHTVIDRLRRSASDEYRLGLVGHPELIQKREDVYLGIYKELTCRKHFLETTGRSLEICAMELADVIRGEIKC